MLNGEAPILIVTFYNKALSDFFSNVPLIGEDLATLVGIPVPIYLDERLTGVYVDSETRAIDIETNSQPRFDGKKPIVDQRGINSMSTINIFAKKDSIMLTVLLALCDMIFSKVVSKEYSVTYLNGPTVILGGLFHGFQTSVDSDNDLVRITLQLSKANQESTAPSSVISVLPRITGAIPVGG